MGVNDEQFGDFQEEDVLAAIESKYGKSNFELEHYKLKPLNERIGLLGDHAVLNVIVANKDTNMKEEASFFVKFVPQMKASAEFAEGIGAFKKEMFVYDLLAKFSSSDINIIKSCTPTCYTKQLNKYLVLDNLDLEGFKPLNKHDTLDYASVLVILEALAKLHASSLIYEEKKSKELETTKLEKYRLLDEYPEDFDETFFSDKENFANAQGIRASIKCVVREIDIFNFPHKLVCGKNFAELAETMCNKIYQLVKPSGKYRNVLSHGDLWATNFLLKYDKDRPKQCKFVDFQCGRYVPPSQDVLSMIYLTTSREFRQKYMYQLIGMYYSYLEKLLKVAGFEAKNIVPFADFMESCEEQKLFAIIQTAIYFPLILISNDLVKEYFNDEELYRKALYEDRSYLVLRHMEKDELYAGRLKDSIRDLKDYCELL